jgi:Domain of unknown function (DUF6438)
VKGTLLRSVFAAVVMTFAVPAAAFAQCHRGTITYGDIEAVRYARTPCFGRCPVDEVLLSRQGNYYVGRKYVAKTGTYTNADGNALARAIHLLEESRYFTLVVPKHSAFVTDLPHSIISVERCGVTTVLDWNHMAGSGPLEALFKRLDAARDSLTWKKSSDAMDSPLPRLAPIF